MERGGASASPVVTPFVEMDAELAQLLGRYGYLVVFLAALLEGETVLVMAGFASHQGYLQLPLVVAAACAGGMLGDQMLFHLGRTRGTQILERFPVLQAPAGRALRLLEGRQVPIIIGVRFMYGLRLAGPLAIGMSDVTRTRFLALNLLGALVWAALFGAIGYGFGRGAEGFLGNLREYEKYVLFALLAIGCGVGLLHWFRRHARSCRSPQAGEGS
jgi:membrane protein DedA with SNARE-associated domain